MKALLVIVPLFAVLVAAVAWAVYVWTSLDNEMGMHGWIALTLGAVLSLAIGFGLMGLVFYSSRRGYDDRAH